MFKTTTAKHRRYGLSPRASAPREAAGGGSRPCIPASPLGEPAAVPGSWLKPHPVLATAGNWGVNERMEEQSLSLSSKEKSNKQT